MLITGKLTSSVMKLKSINKAQFLLERFLARFISCGLPILATHQEVG